MPQNPCLHMKKKTSKAQRKEKQTHQISCTKYLSALHFYERKRKKINKEEKHLQRLALIETKEQ